MTLEDELGICCGNTTEMREHLHKTLTIFALRGAEQWDRSVSLMDQHLGKDSAMRTVYLHFLDKLDLIEHGTGISGSWLTNHGEKMLARLDKAHGSVELAAEPSQ